jgi:hypothetical protein
MEIGRLGTAGGGRQCCQRWRAVAGGGARRNIVGDGLTGAPVRQNSRDKDQKKEGDTRNSLKGLDRRKTCRRRRSTARAELRFGFLGDGCVEERRSSSVTPQVFN